MFRKNISSSSSGLKNKPSTKPARKQVARAQLALLTGFLLGLFFDPEDGSDMFLRNVS
jgi:hypothetical protein